MDYKALFVALEHFFEARPSLESRRVFHGRGGCFEGLSWCCVDYFSPVLICSFFSEPPAGFIKSLSTFIAPLLNDRVSGVVLKRRYIKSDKPELLIGEMPEQLYARRKELKFELNLQAQNIGFFLDIEPGRQWLEERVQGKRVLNLFSYSCVFSALAISAGAQSVVNVDMSKGILSRGRDNHRINKLATKNVSFLPLNILKSWSRIRKAGAYDVIIIDPPSFQKGSFVAEKDYPKVVRRIPEWLDQSTAEGLDILACLNAPELSPEFLSDIFRRELPKSHYQCSLPANPDFIDISQSSALKLQCFRLQSL